MRRVLVLLFAMMLLLPSVATAESSTGTRDNPIPFGETARVGDWELSITSYTPNAISELRHEVQGIDTPESGEQYALATVKATYVGSEIGKLWIDLTFKAVGSLNVGYDYEDECPSVPNSAFDISDVFPTGEVEFNQCWSVRNGDAKSLVMYVDELFAFDSKPVFFSLIDDNATPTGSATPDS